MTSGSEDGGGASERRYEMYLRPPYGLPPQREHSPTRHGDCFLLHTYNARTVSSNAALQELLEAINHIKYHVIALQETKSRKTDVRRMNDGTLASEVRSFHRETSAALALSYIHLSSGSITSWRKSLNITRKERSKLLYDGEVLNDALSSYDWQGHGRSDRRLRRSASTDSSHVLNGLSFLDQITLVASPMRQKIYPRQDESHYYSIATHLERLHLNISCRQAMRKDLQQYRQQRQLEAALNRTSLRKCRRDLQDHTTPLACLKREDGTLATSRFEMEEITERFYSNLYRPDPEIPTGETTPRILPSEVRVAIASMKGGTTPGPDKISTDLLRAGRHQLRALLASQAQSLSSM
ncbi:hypothetical protein OSTOST_02435 [Ostertagia ostertagi]